MLVVTDGGGYGGGSDVLVDLRVDDHPDPVRELQRLLDLHALYFGRPEDALLPLDRRARGRGAATAGPAGRTRRSRTGPASRTTRSGWSRAAIDPVVLEQLRGAGRS